MVNKAINTKNYMNLYMEFEFNIYKYFFCTCLKSYMCPQEKNIFCKFEIFTKTLHVEVIILDIHVYES